MLCVSSTELGKIHFSQKQPKTTPFASSSLDYPLMVKKRVTGELKTVTE